MQEIIDLLFFYENLEGNIYHNTNIHLNKFDKEEQKEIISFVYNNYDAKILLVESDEKSEGFGGLKINFKSGEVTIYSYFDIIYKLS